MHALIARMRKARESELPLGDDGKRLVIRRPTDLDMLELRGQWGARTALRFVVGWAGFSELDFDAGGTSKPVDFDPDLACEWIADRAEHMLAVAEHVVAAYNSHASSASAAEKN